MNSPPQYVAPPPDPGLEVLKAQNEQQQAAAITDRVSSESARLMTMYGTRIATAGNTNWSPLVAAPAGGGFTPPSRPLPVSGSY